jgi:hypothetical protein
MYRISFFLILLSISFFVFNKLSSYFDDDILINNIHSDAKDIDSEKLSFERKQKNTKNNTLILIRDLKYKAFYIVANKNNHEYYFTINKYNELILDEKNKDIFVMTDGLLFPLSNKECVGFFSIAGQGKFLLPGSDGIVSSFFMNTDAYKKKTMFCLHYNSKQEYFSVSNSKGSPLLFSRKNKSLLSDSRVYLYNKNQNLQLEQIKLEFIEINKDQLPGSINIPNKNGFVEHYLLNKKSHTYENKKYDVDSKFYYQPLAINRTSFREFEKMKGRPIYSDFLKVKKNTHEITIHKRDSYISHFVLLPSLLSHELRGCVSFVSYLFQGKFITIKNNQMLLEKYQRNKDFHTRASFCFEKHSNNDIRLKNYQNPDFYVNYHTMDNGFVYVVKDDITDDNFSTFSLDAVKNSLTVKKIKFFDTRTSKYVKYGYSGKIKKFIKLTKQHEDSEYEINLIDKPDLSSISNLECLVFNEKNKIYYSAVSSISNEKFIYYIDKDDLPLLTSFTCSKEDKDFFILNCEIKSKYISLRDNCKLLVTNESKQEIYEGKELEAFNFLSFK